MMKVLIVDDEKNIREGIKCFIEWDALGCTVVNSCANGIAALEYIESNPVDIVITDVKMPVMDGLELCKNISEKYPDIKVVILTAYSDFEMAKSAIKYGVIDFIVKNDFMEEIPLAIKKIEDSFKNDERKDDGIKLKGYRFCVCACEIESTDETSSYNLEDMLKNILGVSLKECKYEVISKTNSYFNIIIKYLEDSNINLNVIVEAYNNILIMVEEFMRINLRVGLSNEADSPEELQRLIEESERALSTIASGGNALCISNNISEGDSEADLIDIEYYKSEICGYAFEENDMMAKEVLEILGDELSSKGICFEQCQLYALVIYSAVIHKAVSYHLDTDQDFNQIETAVYKKIQESKTIYGLLEVGKDTLNMLRALCIGKMNVKNELVDRVDDCIRNNYKNELNLNFISNTLYMNNSYISRAYKKLTGITVTDKINLYRIGKAKELLKTTSMMVYEIAAEVGFKDAAYFTNVFIKHCGVNPSEYRLGKV